MVTILLYHVKICFHRASTILPKDADRKRYLFYSAFCFGLPFVATTFILSLDRMVVKGGGRSSATDVSEILLDMRPGFGEESCWFTSCSHSLTYFLYM